MAMSSNSLKLISLFFTMMKVLPVMSIAAVGEGNVLMEFFNGNFDCKPADLTNLTPHASVQIPNVNIASTGDHNPIIYGVQTGSNWAARFSAWLHVSQNGQYTFEASKGASDSAALSVNGVELFSSKCGENAPSRMVTLAAGYHQVILTFTDDGWQDQIVLSYQGPDTRGALNVIPADRFAPSNVLMEFFNGNFDCSVSDLSKLTPHAHVYVPNVQMSKTEASNPKIYGIQTGSNWAARFTSGLHITQGGLYIFDVKKWAADSVALYIDGHKVLSGNCGNSNPREKVSLTAGHHVFMLTFMDDGWQDEVVLSYQGPDTAGKLDVIPANKFQAVQWIVGREGQDCTTVCSAVGKACDLGALTSIDTSAEIISAADSAAYTCASTVSWAYDNNPGICTNSLCCGDGSCIGACAYGRNDRTSRSCAGTPAGHFSRICPCNTLHLLV